MSVYADSQLSLSYDTDYGYKECPDCDGDDEFCPTCDGTGEIERDEEDEYWDEYEARDIP